MYRSRGATGCRAGATRATPAKLLDQLRPDCPGKGSYRLSLLGPGTVRRYGTVQAGDYALRALTRLKPGRAIPSRRTSTSHVLASDDVLLVILLIPR